MSGKPSADDRKHEPRIVSAHRHGKRVLARVVRPDGWTGWEILPPSYTDPGKAIGTIKGELRGFL